MIKKEISCKKCSKPIIRTGYNQKYCGSQKEKGSCSYFYKNRNNNKYNQNKLWTDRTKYIKSDKWRFLDYKKGAKRRNKEFDLSFEEFSSFNGKPCFYCGEILNAVALDRVVNTIGYIPSNVVPCCWICNRMKMVLSKDEFINQCNKISKRFFL